MVKQTNSLAHTNWMCKYHIKDMFKEVKSVYKSAKNDSKYDEKDSRSMD